MSTWQRSLACAALLLVALGIVLGIGEALKASYGTLPALQHQSQRMAVSQRGPGEVPPDFDATGYAYVRVVDAHTHFIKLATVLLLLAVLYPTISLEEEPKRALTVMFVAGTVLFPAGVLSEIYVRGWPAQALAAAGALLVIVSFGGMLRGLLKHTQASN